LCYLNGFYHPTVESDKLKAEIAVWPEKTKMWGNNIKNRAKNSMHVSALTLSLTAFIELILKYQSIASTEGKTKYCIKIRTIRFYWLD
jgi:hypothetical protein